MLHPLFLNWKNWNWKIPILYFFFFYKAINTSQSHADGACPPVEGCVSTKVQCSLKIFSIFFVSSENHCTFAIVLPSAESPWVIRVGGTHT